MIPAKMSNKMEKEGHTAVYGCVVLQFIFLIHHWCIKKIKCNTTQLPTALWPSFSIRFEVNLALHLCYMFELLSQKSLFVIIYSCTLHVQLYIISILF